jgi:hypothetical protein
VAVTVATTTGAVVATVAARAGVVGRSRSPGVKRAASRRPTGATRAAIAAMHPTTSAVASAAALSGGGDAANSCEGVPSSVRAV